MEIGESSPIWYSRRFDMATNAAIVTQVRSRCLLVLRTLEKANSGRNWSPNNERLWHKNVICERVHCTDVSGRIRKELRLRPTHPFFDNWLEDTYLWKISHYFRWVNRPNCMEIAKSITSATYAALQTFYHFLQWLGKWSRNIGFHHVLVIVEKADAGACFENLW